MIVWGREGGGVGYGRVLMRLHRLQMARLFLCSGCEYSVGIKREKFVNYNK